MSDWISVEYTTPKAYELLQIKTEAGGIYYSRYWDGSFWYNDYSDWFSDVTHYRYVEE